MPQNFQRTSLQPLTELAFQREVGPFRSRIYYWKSDRPAFPEGSRRRRTDRDELVRMLEGELRRAFPGKEIALAPAGGQGNHVTYLAKIADLQGFVRVEDGLEGGDCLELETRILRTVRATGVPAPVVYAVDATRTRVPFAWQVLECVADPDLMRLNKREPLNLTKLAFEIGRNIALWQGIPVQGFGPFDPELSDGHLFAGYHATYSDYFFLHFDRHLGYLQEDGFFNEDKTNEIQEVVRENLGLLDLKKGCLVHKDLALWNILGTRENISAFIDWEDAISGDPMDDFSLLGCFHSGDVVERALEGYMTGRSLPENHRRRFWLHLLRNMLVKAVIRIGAGYFQEGDDLFLMDSGSNGAALKEFTLGRIDAAVAGLREDRKIARL